MRFPSVLLLGGCGHGHGFFGCRDDHSSEDDWSSEDEQQEGDSTTTTHNRVLLRIRKDKLGSPTSGPPSGGGGGAGATADPLTKLLRATRPPSLKKQLLGVYRLVVGKTDGKGRVLSELFLRRPSSKHYPEYYLVIKNPVDLREILGRIRSGGFSSLQALGEALELMVSNALTFNEEDSQVYCVSC